MKIYQAPEFALVVFDDSDILTTSGTLVIGGTDGFGNGDWGLEDKF